MPSASKFLICKYHLEGPLDVWYDCHLREHGTKQEALPRQQCMTQADIVAWPDHTPEMISTIKDFFVRRRSTGAHLFSVRSS